MGGTYTIYAYFNQEQIQSVLNAIVMLVGAGGTNGDYLSLIRVAAMLGLFLAVTLGFVRARGEDAAQYLIMVALFYSTLFVPRVTVTIEEASGSGGAPVTVDNVPLGLAFFASTTSHIGHWLTEQTETFFALPDTELQLSHHGLMGGARALREAQNANIQDPVLAADLVSFMRDCINPELLSNPAQVNTLLNSTDIWTELGSVINPGRTVSLLSSGSTLSCHTAYTSVIPTAMAPAITSVVDRVARIISPYSTPSAANTALASMLPAAEGLIMTASASAAESIKQRMLINMMNETSSSLAQIMNDPAAAQTALGTAMAAQSANSGYRITAKIASETLPIIRNAIELVIIGVFPIMLIIIIIAGSKGGVVLRSYVMTMLWLQLWAPMYAIVNFVGTMAHAKSAKAALGGIDGLAIANAAAFANSTISSEAVVGILTITVPMIALALVKGGEVAMSGVVSSVTGGASSAATRAGEAVGTGNISLGNTSWGNGQYNSTAANKHNTDGVIFGGAMQTRDNQNGNLTDTFGNRTVGHIPQHTGGPQGKIGATASSSLRQEAANKLESSFNHAVSAGQEAMAALNNITSRGSDRVTTNRTGNSIVNGERASDAVSSSDGASRGTTNSFKRDIVASAITSITGGGGLHLGGGFDLGSQGGTPGVPSATPQAAAPGQPAATPAPSAAQILGPNGLPLQPTAQPTTQTPSSKPSLQGKASGSIGGDYAIQAKTALQRALASNDTVAIQQATAKVLEYAKTANSQYEQGTDTKGSNGSRNEVSANIANAEKHLEQSQAALAQSKAFTEAANITKGTESGVSFAHINPGTMSADELFKLNEALNKASPSERAQILEGIRSQTAGGDPKLADNFMSNKPVPKDESAIREDHAENLKRPEVQNNTAGAHQANKKIVGASATGTGSVPLNKREELRNAALRDRAKTTGEYDHSENKDAMGRSQRNVDAHTGDYGKTPDSALALTPNTKESTSLQTMGTFAFAAGGKEMVEKAQDIGLLDKKNFVQPEATRPVNVPAWKSRDEKKAEKKDEKK